MPVPVAKEWTEEWGGWGDGEWSDTKGEWEGEFWDEGHEGHEGHEGDWNEDEQGEWEADAPADQGWTDEMEWEADDQAEWAAPVQPTDSADPEAEAAEWHEAEEAENEVDTPYHLTLGGNRQ